MFVILYFILGLILYFFQEKWVKKNDPEFFEAVDDFNYFIYLIISVVSWLPLLLWFIFLRLSETFKK